MNEQSRAEEQEVRDLIAEAGPRAVPPAEEVEKIKAAARAEWREMVRREDRRSRSLRRRGGLALAAGVVLALAVGWWWTNRGPVAAPVVASVELIAGAVRVGDAGRLEVGGELRAGVTVETGGWLDGMAPGAALRLEGGQSLRLAADTRVRLLSASRFELERGTLYVDAESATARGAVEVVTALGTVRDIGTQFEVRLSEGEAAIRVRVREGECSLETAGESHNAVRGEQISRLADGSIARAAVEPYGPEWDWVMATAPSITIDGRSLADVAGELGVHPTTVSRARARSTAAHELSPLEPRGVPRPAHRAQEAPRGE